ncbi:MAG: translation initiation factor IF-2 N-terminal domain-containing protein, partial [Vulcanimicrobiaceae bacterium]
MGLRAGLVKGDMAGKVRIFELAKELGISSKEMLGLFERLGLEAKNQLSVVDDPIAELVRSVLGGAKAKPAPAKAAPAGRAKA